MGEDSVIRNIRRERRLFRSRPAGDSASRNSGGIRHRTARTGPDSNRKSADIWADRTGLSGPDADNFSIQPGATVSSDLFDHTSVLRFLETRFGAEVPNLSAWRHAAVGDMTRAFNFAKIDTSLPNNLPSPVPPLPQILAEIRRDIGRDDAVHSAYSADLAYAGGWNRGTTERGVLVS